MRMKCSSGINGGFGLEVLTFRMYVIPFCYNKHITSEFQLVTQLSFLCNEYRQLYFEKPVISSVLAL